MIVAPATAISVGHHQRVEVAGELEHEHRARERSLHRGGEERGAADQCVAALGRAVPHVCPGRAGEPGEEDADRKGRREQAARRARRHAGGGDERLEQEEHHEQPEREAAVDRELHDVLAVAEQLRVRDREERQREERPDRREVTACSLGRVRPAREMSRAQP